MTADDTALVSAMRARMGRDAYYGQASLYYGVLACQEAICAGRYRKTVGKPRPLRVSKGGASTRAAFTPDAYTIYPFGVHLPRAMPNRDAAQLGRQTGVNAANIPGFILLGLADEIVNQGGGSCFGDVVDARGLLLARTETTPPASPVA